MRSIEIGLPGQIVKYEEMPKEKSTLPMHVKTIMAVDGDIVLEHHDGSTTQMRGFAFIMRTTNDAKLKLA